MHLYGSLALTGEGHGTPRALVLGLQGWAPDRVPVKDIPSIIQRVRDKKLIGLTGGHSIPFDIDTDIVMEKAKRLPRHSNAMRFTALDAQSDMLLTRAYYSVGGGFVVSEEAACTSGANIKVPFEIHSGSRLLEICKRHGRSISKLVEANEVALKSPNELEAQIDNIWSTMDSSIEAGLCSTEQHLPGVLKLLRRAPSLYEKLKASYLPAREDFLSVYAMAVNEENAAGGRVVTAPTNGAAGIIPATLRFYLEFMHDKSKNQSAVIKDFLLTATAIGSLYKQSASISAAEVGCQGEVGVACSMAAAGLAAAMEGTPEQVEHAAEIGMEHCLGMTCDPIAGLVQVPCIERNALGAAKALTAARLAMLGDGSHQVSLDTVIASMYSTGLDMNPKYKETSLGGLARHHPPCG